MNNFNLNLFKYFYYVVYYNGFTNYQMKNIEYLINILYSPCLGEQKAVREKKPKPW